MKKQTNKPHYTAQKLEIKPANEQKSPQKSGTFYVAFHYIIFSTLVLLSLPMVQHLP
jgi:hypothetical protein